MIGFADLNCISSEGPFEGYTKEDEDLRSLWRTNQEIADIYRRNVKTVFRVCALFFRGSVHDAEDAVQTTFLRLMKDTTRFDAPEHEKAWLIVTAGNVCKNMLTSGWKRNVELDETALQQSAVRLDIDETLRSVMALPGKYKTAIYMHYYEGYSAKEIASYMGKTEPTIRRYIHDGRGLLKLSLKEGG